MYNWVGGRVGGGMNEWMDEQMDEWVGGKMLRIERWTDGWTDKLSNSNSQKETPTSPPNPKV